MQEAIYILLGSNLGERQTNLDYASELLSHFVGDIVQQSSVYETMPWGKEEQPPFYNQILYLMTDLTPEHLMLTALQIEEKLGRVRKQKWQERIIDIDILYYGNQIIDTAQLSVPHPEIQNRRFTLVPLVEIAPNFTHPILKKTSLELLELCPDPLEVKRVINQD